MSHPKLEVCVGSWQDCLAADAGKANRVELNSALSVGGLTPTIQSLKKVKEDTDLEVICMVRPRAGGFHYDDQEAEIMMLEAQALLDAGADGIAFGFLKKNGEVDIINTQVMTDLIHRAGKTAVFHRAFDVTPDPDEAMKTLIEIGIDRVLTSGQKSKALAGADLIAHLQNAYGDQIQILPGSGVNATNAAQLIEETGVNQVHSSCKGYKSDPTTIGNDVSYAYLPEPHQFDYDVVEEKLVRDLREVLDQIEQ